MSKTIRIITKIKIKTIKNNKHKNNISKLILVVKIIIVKARINFNNNIHIIFLYNYKII